ncbi:MAG: hypothetical protein COT73_07360 [Bdellovibrio sp. CG10_big_fil_rev_8_21_14_0_10_47_8]|nr:MAG: hypothetical protein COT73_07360 [Bdellovibrio sp. CG10_big_fil_rev_8_21_14_0_10_47_8]
MKKALLYFCTMILLSATAAALEPQNPEGLCDRFLGEKEKTSCLAKIKKMQPDWYLASTCAKQFDDKSFYECLDLNQVTLFSPKKLEACEASMDDTDRIKCIRSAAATKSDQAFQKATSPRMRGRQGSVRLSEGY